MRYLSIISLSFLFLFFGFDSPQREIKNHCTYEKSRDKSRLALRPYRYTAQKTQRLTLKNYKQFREVMVPLFYDSKYRFVFNAEGMPGNLNVKIYDEPQSKSNRDPVYETQTYGGQFSYETEEGGKYDKLYVDFIFPTKKSSDLDLVERGCVVMLVGYQVEHVPGGVKAKDEDSGGGGFLSGLFGSGDKKDKGKKEKE